MKFSLGWLRELAAVPAGVSARQIAARLTAAGFHVEAVEQTAEDTILDVDVTTNRVDAMNHVGLARELAAHFEVPLRVPPPMPQASGGSASAQVSIAAPALCRCYVALVVRGVRLAESPAWLRRRLLAIGLRPINNVVDVTNYVLWERGQPLHAFDLDTLAERRIVVREAVAGEGLRTLDGEQRPLAPGTLVIADGARPVGLAGVMGGLETQVKAGTRDVLLESAWFDAGAVRRTAKQLGMHTDASHRFERGVDPEGAIPAALRAAGLLVELAGAAAVEPPSIALGEPLPPVAPIPLSAARLATFAGAAIAPDRVEALLGAVGFGLAAAGGVAGQWRVSVPSWRRFDVLEEADLFEEVLRLHGFDRVPPALPAVGGPDAPELPGHRLRGVVRRQLAEAGFAEAIDWAFYGPPEDERFEAFGASGPALRLVNPLSERHALMRRSLLPGLLEAASYNRRRGLPAVRLFEVGHVFWRAEDGTPREAEHVAFVVGGRDGTPWQRLLDLDLFDAKGALEALMGVLDRPLEAHAATVRGLIPGRGAHLRVSGEEAIVGILGQLDEPPSGYPLYVAELATAPFVPVPPAARVALPSRLPGVAVDLTLTHGIDVPWAALAAAIEAQRPAQLVAFDLENRYQGPEVPAGAVNTTIHFLYNGADRSLTQEEVNARHREIAATLVERFGWTGPPPLPVA